EGELLQQRGPRDADRRAADQRRDRGRLSREAIRRGGDGAARKGLGALAVAVAAVGCAVLASGCAGGGGSSEAPSAQASPGPRASARASAPRGPALGIGEARKPEPFTLEQRLLDAASRGDRATIDRALELGAPIGAKDDLGRSLVVLAATDAGDLDLVQYLRAKGAALDEPDVQGRAALSFAAANGRVDIVRYLVDAGASVDRADVQQRTPLYHAVGAGQRDVVAFLLDRGANPNVQDQFGDTPLMVACAKGDGEIAQLLLDHRADPSLKDQEGRTARERSAPGVEACRRR